MLFQELFQPAIFSGKNIVQIGSRLGVHFFIASTLKSPELNHSKLVPHLRLSEAMCFAILQGAKEAFLFVEFDQFSIVVVFFHM